MNITVINRLMGIRFGGGENFDLCTAKELEKQGHKVRVIAGRRLKKIDVPIQEIATYYISSPYLRWIDYKLQDKNIVSKIISKSAFLSDLLMFQVAVYYHLLNDEWTDIYQICGLARLGSWLEKKGRPCVIYFPGPPRKILAKHINKCSASSSSGNAFNELSMIDPNAINIPPGVDIENFFPDTRKRNTGKVTITFVGRLIEIKNLPFLIRCFNKLFKDYSDIQLRIVGEGDLYQRLKQMVQSDIIFTGFKKGIELLDEYQRSDIFVIPSRYESYSMVTLEAMACALPIIASNVGYLPNLVKDNGVLVESGNDAELINALSVLIKNKIKRIEMGSKSRQYAINHYSWLNSARQIENLYLKILKPNNK